MERRLTYSLLGTGIGLSIRLVLLLLRGTHDWLNGMMSLGSLSMAISCGVLIAWIAERKKKVMFSEALWQPAQV